MAPPITGFISRTVSATSEKPPPPVAAPPNEINSAMSVLNDCVQSAAERLANLAQKLDPVLTPEKPSEPSPGAQGCDEPIRSSLANGIRLQAARVDNLGNFIRHITERLEL